MELFMSEQAMQMDAIEPSNDNATSYDAPVEAQSEASDLAEDSSVGEVSDEQTRDEASEGEIPEGIEPNDASSNAENAKRRIERKNRRRERELEELRAFKAQYDAQLSQMHQQQYPQMQNQAQQAQQLQQPYQQPESVVDPVTGEYLTPGTGRYDAVLFDQQKAMLEKQMAQQRQQQEAQYYQQQLDNSFSEAIEDALDRYEDYEDVVTKAQPTQAMLDVARITPNGADLLYYISKNPKEVQRISKLHPLVQQQEMAKHAISFATRNKVSKAPPPVQPVSNTAGQSSNSFRKIAQDPRALAEYYRAKQRG
jgi:hypothetical protein